MDFLIWGPIARDDLPGLCDRVCALLSANGSGGRSHEVARRHATSRAVAENKPAAGRLRRVQVDTCRAVGRLDVEHRRGVCRPMSSSRRRGRSFVPKTKGLTR